MAEEQRRAAFVGLAAASALVVLIASGVAISRLGSGDHGGRSRVATSSPEQPSGEAGPASSGGPRDSR